MTLQTAPVSAGDASARYALIQIDLEQTGWSDWAADSHVTSPACLGNAFQALMLVKLHQSCIKKTNKQKKKQSVTFRNQKKGWKLQQVVHIRPKLHPGAPPGDSYLSIIVFKGSKSRRLCRSDMEEEAERGRSIPLLRLVQSNTVSCDFLLQHLQGGPCRTSTGCASSISTGGRPTPGDRSTRWTAGYSLLRYSRILGQEAAAFPEGVSGCSLTRPPRIC